MTNWLDLSNNANCFKSIYEQGFVDLSGGSIQTRNDNQKLIIAGDSSLNNAYLGEITTIMVDGTTLLDVNITGTAANMISQHSANETVNSRDFLAISGDGKTYAIWHYNGYARLYVYKDLGDGNGYTKIVDDFLFDTDTEGQVKLNYDGTKMLLTAKDDLQSYGGNDDGGLAIVLEYDPTKTTYNTDYTHSSGILPANYGPVGWKIMGNAIFGPNNGHLGDVMDNQNENISISDDGLTFAFGVWDTPENAYVYTWDGSAWALKGSIISEPSSVSNFGKFLSLSGDGNSIIVGSDNDKHWVFKWSGTAWEQQGGYIDITGANNQRSQAINTDGTVIAVGDMGSTGEDGTIKIFDRNPSETNANHVGWTQRGNTITDTSQDVLLGMNVYITSDGNMIATRMWNSTSQKNIYKYNSSNATWDNLPYDSNVDSNGLIKHVALSKFGTHIALINHNTSKVQVHEIEGENVYEQIPFYSGNMSVGCDTYTPNAIDISGTMDICGNLFSSGDISLNSGIYNTAIVPGTASNGAVITGQELENNPSTPTVSYNILYDFFSHTSEDSFISVGSVIYDGYKYDYTLWTDRWTGNNGRLSRFTTNLSTNARTVTYSSFNSQGRSHNWATFSVGIYQNGDIITFIDRIGDGSNDALYKAGYISNARSTPSNPTYTSTSWSANTQFGRMFRVSDSGIIAYADKWESSDHIYKVKNMKIYETTSANRSGCYFNHKDDMLYLNYYVNSHICMIDMSLHSGNQNIYLHSGSGNNTHLQSYITRYVPHSDFVELLSYQSAGSVSFSNQFEYIGIDKGDLLIFRRSSPAMFIFWIYVWDSNQNKYIYTGTIDVPGSLYAENYFGDLIHYISDYSINSINDITLTFIPPYKDLCIARYHYDGTNWNTKLNYQYNIDETNPSNTNSHTWTNSTKSCVFDSANNKLIYSFIQYNKYTSYNNSSDRLYLSEATTTFPAGEITYADVSIQQQEPAKLFIGNDCSVNGNITYTNLSIDNMNVSYSEDTNMSTNLKVNNTNNGSGTTTTLTNVSGASLTHISANYDSTTDSIDGFDLGHAYLYGVNSAISMNDSGSRVIAGSSYMNSYDGKVVIYENQSGTWIKIGDMDGPSSPNDSRFGGSVDMNSDGSTIIIGAYSYDDSDDQGLIQVYTYSGSGTTWNKKGSDIIGTGINNYFGHIVKINNDGTRIFTGTTSYDRVVIWDYNSGTSEWVQIGNINIGNTVASLSINNTGSRFAAGKDTANGQALIYEYSGSGTTWNLIGDIQGPGLNCEYVGLSGDGNTISVHGSSDESNIIVPYNGGGTVVYKYSGSGTTWNQKGDTIYGPNSSAGARPKLNNDGTIILLPYISSTLYGVVHLCAYNSNSNTWTQLFEEIGTYVQSAGNYHFGENVYLLQDGTKCAISSGKRYVKIYDITYTGSTTSTSNPISLQIHGDLDSTPTFSANVDVSNNIIVPGNITIIDSSANNYGAYTVYTTKDASTHFSVGKSASNVFNIVNQNNAGVYMVSGNNSLTSTSDIRLKKEIEPLEDATERIMKLNPCTYKWKTQTDEKRHVGFIAQEVEEVFPELVRETTYPDGSTYKGVATEDLVGYLIKVMENQENELNLLKEKMK